jgi:hypothetical protein
VSRAHLLDALRAVDGVADAEIVDDDRGVGTLRLTLAPGADEVEVAVSVNGVLRDRFGLAVDSGKVQVIEETWSSRAATASSRTAVAAAGGGAAMAAAPAPPAPQARPAQPASPTDPARFAASVRSDVRSAGPQPPAPSDPPPTPAPVPSAPDSVIAGARRMAIRRLQLVSTSTGISTAVSLGLGPRTFVGEADAGSSPESVQWAVAVATLRAIEDVIEGAATLELVHVEVAPVADEWVVLVSAHLETAHGTAERLTGAAVVREDVRQAVIRATLDAVNRRVEALLADTELNRR